jgi:hypothetical protein
MSCAGASAEERTDAAPRMPKRIRMVEAGVLRDLLGGSGCAVVEAPDGQDGVANPISA